MCTDWGTPTAITKTAPMSGPITGTISTSPTKPPTSSL